MFLLQQECPQWFLVWEAQFQGFFIVPKNINGRKIKILFLYPHSEKNFKTYVKQSRCCEVFTIHHDLIYEPFDS